MSLLCEKEMKPTIGAGVVVKTKPQGTMDYRPAALILHTLPNDKHVHTGHGAAALDIFMTQEIHDQITDRKGHGRIIVVPQSTLDSMMAAYIIKE